MTDGEAERASRGTRRLRSRRWLPGWSGSGGHGFGGRPRRAGPEQRLAGLPDGQAPRRRRARDVDWGDRRYGAGGRTGRPASAACRSRPCVAAGSEKLPQRIAGEGGIGGRSTPGAAVEVGRTPVAVRDPLYRLGGRGRGTLGVRVVVRRTTTDAAPATWRPGHQVCRRHLEPCAVRTASEAGGAGLEPVRTGWARVATWSTTRCARRRRRRGEAHLDRSWLPGTYDEGGPGCRHRPRRRAARCWGSRQPLGGDGDVAGPLRRRRR